MPGSADAELRRSEITLIRDRTDIRLIPMPASYVGPSSQPWFIPAKTKPLRRIAFEMGRQFRREGDFDVPPFQVEPYPDGRLDEAVVFPCRHFASVVVMAAGAAGFREFDGKPCMDWIWIHPYERGRLLRQAWPALEREYGEFLIKGPYSAPMTRFLERAGVDEQRWRGHPKVARRSIFLPETVSVRIGDPESVARSLRRHMSPADLARLAELLDEGGAA